MLPEVELPGHALILVVCALSGVGFLVWLFFQLRPGVEANRAGLNYVIGPMGAGKSMFGVREIVAALVTGTYAITNIRLLPGWAEAVAKREFPRDRGDARARRARWLEGFYVYEADLDRVLRYRVPCAYCSGDPTKPGTEKGTSADPATCSHAGPANEGRALVVWDESHNDLSNRDYLGFGETKDARELEKLRRRRIIRWATHLRKLGYVGYLLSQHHENTDAQLRRVCNHVVRLQNQRSVSKLAKLLPRRMTMFLVYWYPAHLADGTNKVEAIYFQRYLLPWTRHLYNSWEVFHGLDGELAEGDLPIVLPAGGRSRHPADAGPRESGVASALQEETSGGRTKLSQSPRVGARGRDGAVASSPPPDSKELTLEAH